MSAFNTVLADKSTAGTSFLIAELQTLQSAMGEMQSKLANLLARVESELLHPPSPVAAIAVDASVNARAAGGADAADAMAAVHRSQAWNPDRQQRVTALINHQLTGVTHASPSRYRVVGPIHLEMYAVQCQ